MRDTGVFRKAAQSLVRPWAVILGGRLCGAAPAKVAPCRLTLPVRSSAPTHHLLHPTLQRSFALNIDNVIHKCHIEYKSHLTCYVQRYNVLHIGYC